MTDFSPELLAAREALLQGIMATWKKPPDFTGRLQQALVRPVYPITIEAAMKAAEHYGELWLEAHREKQAILDAGTAGKIDGYWKREHRAKALYATSLLLLEALSDGTD